MELFEGNVALPLFISNLVTIMLNVFFGRDRSRQRMAYRNQIAQFPRTMQLTIVHVFFCQMRQS